ncbi:MAG: dephospho-CoA kinase [Anaerolineaceae bacterium]
MSEKPKLLGITGNIASGKSVVRQYLENEGALTIDADLLAQSTYLPGHPAYQPILDAFGSDLCNSDGQINRSKLGRIVFRDPGALQELEAIVHPQVTLAVDEIVSRARVNLVVVEAIKLFEANLHLRCEAVWAVVAEDQVRQERLMSTRGLSEADALTRINSQNPQAEKASRSDYVIHTDISFESTYSQAITGLHALNPDPFLEIHLDNGEAYRPVRPLDFENARLMLNSFDPQTWSDEEILRSLGHRSILAGFKDDQLASLTVWKIDHFLGLLQRILPSCTPQSDEVKAVLQIIERNAKQHLCDALFIPRDMVSSYTAKILGYLPGEYYPADINPFAISNFLRKHGFMPGEVYLKTQF